jgi:DNA-binding transcriptional ArsR family regulator
MRMYVSIEGMEAASSPDPRWQLYRLLGDPFRLRLLALAEAEELALGELAELLDESQPNVSRHAAPLRQAGLLAERRQGTRTLVRLDAEAAKDPVVADALSTGKKLCVQDGSLARISAVVLARDQKTREFFARPALAAEPFTLASELPGYLYALGPVLSKRGLALDAGTGDGALLDALAPLFERVVAVDRSDVQLARAAARARARAYGNVEFRRAELDDPALRTALGAGADVVVAARMLHHAPLPRVMVDVLSKLVGPGGSLAIIDYCRHSDEALRDEQADVWMGFDAAELEEHARAAGLVDVRVNPVPAGLVRNPMDGHIAWQALIARRSE